MEPDLRGVLMNVCPRVFPDFAPTLTQRPYVTFQLVGGPTHRFLNGSAGNKRTTRVQVNVWSDSRTESMSLIREIEDAVSTSPLFSAVPQSEPLTDFDADVPVYGAIQDFLIHSTR